LKFEQRRNNWKRTAVVKSARAQALSHVIVVEKTRSSSSREKKKGLAALWKDTKNHKRQVGAKLTTTSEKSEKKKEITFILRSDGGQA
jgi:hypothetical protein